MERKKATDFPQELLDEFDLYVHGDIDRRTFLDRAGKYTVGGLTAAAIFELLKPNYAWAEQVPKNDARIKAEYQTVPSPQGTGSIKGYFVKPASATGKLPVILVVHENRGLNPYIEDVARRLALANFVAFAPDGLTSVGGYPGDDEAGGAAFGKVDRNKMAEDFGGGSLAEGSSGEHGQDRCDRVLLPAAAWPTRWRFVWEPISRQRSRTTARRPRRLTWPRSRRRSSRITASSIPVSPKRGPRSPKRSRRPTFRTRDTSIPRRTTVSTTTPRRGTTKPLPSSPGTAPWPGSTSTSAPSGRSRSAALRVPAPVPGARHPVNHPP